MSSRLHFSDGWIIGLIIAAVVFFISFLVFIGEFCENLGFISFIAFAICFITVIVLGFSQTETDEIIDTQYQVILEDSVSLNDFLDHYEIIEQNGEIYTIREIKDK